MLHSNQDLQILILYCLHVQRSPKTVIFSLSSVIIYQLVTLWNRGEKSYIIQMNGTGMVSINLVYCRTNVHCLYNVIVSFGENICFPPQTAVSYSMAYLLGVILDYPLTTFPDLHIILQSILIENLQSTTCRYKCIFNSKTLEQLNFFATFFFLFYINCWVKYYYYQNILELAK